MSATIRSDAHIIEYAHCVKWTKGQLDCHPWSSYKLVSVAIELQSVTHAPEDIDWKVCVNGECIGLAMSANEAIEDAQWTLMNESRKQARERDEEEAQ